MKSPLSPFSKEGFGGIIERGGENHEPKKKDIAKGVVSCG